MGPSSCPTVWSPYQWKVNINMTREMTGGRGDSLWVQWHVKHGWGLVRPNNPHTFHSHLEVKPSTYSPRPQLCAASLHPFLKVWHWPTSSKRWRAAEIMSFSFPKHKRKEKTLWKRVLKQFEWHGLAQVYGFAVCALPSWMRFRRLTRSMSSCRLKSHWAAKQDSFVHADIIYSLNLSQTT